MDGVHVKSSTWRNVHHFSQSLLDLLRITQTSRKTFLQSVIKDSPREPLQISKTTSLTSPISLATQLVSSTTTLYGECHFSEEFWQNLNGRNIKILSKFPPNSESFDAKQLHDTRILILRVLLGVCHTCCDEKSDLEEIFMKESIHNVLDAIKSILNKHLEKVGQDTSPACMENSPVNFFLKAIEEDTDQFLLRQLFLLQTLLKTFDAIVSGIDPTNADAHEITRLVGLLREFQNSGGYHILMICVQSLVHKITSTSSNGLSSADVCGPLCQEDSQLSLLKLKLKSVFEVFANTCKMVKLLKTNYLHGITCRRRCHNHCDLSSLLHQHHDILGIAVSRHEAVQAVTDPVIHKTRSEAKECSYGISEDGDSVKKSSKKMKKAFESSEIPTSCVIGTAVNFLVQNIFPISPLCVNMALSALDTVGICHCVRPHAFVVPLLSGIRHLEPVHQDDLLATVGRGLLQRMGASSQDAKRFSDGNTDNITCMPSYELPSNYPTLIPPCQQTVSSFIAPICKVDDNDARMTSAFQTISNERLPNFTMLLDKTDLPRWLCLACYRDLLLHDFVPQTDGLAFPSRAYDGATLSEKVSEHLASVAVHFDEESLCVLLTTAILPVLHFVFKKLTGDTESSASCGENNRREVSFMQQRVSLLALRPFTNIVINLMKVIFAGLSEKEEFRKTIIRHSGVELLCSFLLPHLHQCDFRTVKFNTNDIDEDCEKIFDMAAICIKLIVRNASNLSMADKILISPKHISNNEAGNPHNSSKREVTDHTGPVTLFGRIVRGIRKSPKVQQRDSIKHSISHTISSQSTLDHVTLKYETVDERKVFHFDCCKVLSCVMKSLCKILNSGEDAFSVKSDEECENTDDIEPIDEYGATSSKSSGYQSKSRKSSSAASNATNVDVDLLHSSFQDKSSSLPDYHVFQMEFVRRMCSLISVVIQVNDMALEEFCNLDGPKVFLRILLSTAISLDYVKKNSDATQTISESTSENYSYDSLHEHTEELMKEAESSHSLDATEVKSVSSDDSEELPGVISPEITQERELERKYAEEDARGVAFSVDLKLKVLSSSLYVSLLCSKKNSNSELSSDDIISMLKPPLQRSHLMCTKYCESMCKALFEASVEARISTVKESKEKISYVVTEVKESNPSPVYDHENSSDGYQGDTESNSGDDSAFSLFSPNIMEKVPKPLIDSGLVFHPELIELIAQLLGDARKDLLSFDSSEESSLLLPLLPLLSLQQCSDNIRSAISTTASLIQFGQKNFETMLNNSDLPLVFMESFNDILENDCIEEQDIRQSILELCLMFNMEHMSAEHLRLVLSFFNSVHPPMEQLLKYLLVLINNLYAGPGHCLQFPVDGKSIDYLPEDPHRDAEEAYSLSVWKIAPLRLPINGNVRWPTTNVGLTISLWLQVGSFGYLNKWKNDLWRSYSATDIDHETHFCRHGSVDFDPYHHLVSIGTKQSMLQIWLEGGTLIFRICVDAHDGKPVGVLAQTECPGLISLNAEWQHITFTYTENQLPDKTILGKVHAIVNCTSETDIILEHVAPSNSRGITSRKNSDRLTLFVGHWIRPVQTKFSLQDSSGYQLGTIMVFDGIHFTMRSAFAIYRQGPDISNLTECLETADEENSSVSASAKVRLSHSLNFAVSPVGSPPSPPRTFGFGSYKQFFPLPHSFLVSDLASEEFFTDRTLPNSISLQEHLVLSYSPTDPTIYLCNPVFTKPVESKKRSRSFSFFSSSTSSNASNSTEEFDPLNFQSMQMQVEQLVTIYPFENMGLQRSLTQVGGVPVFLMLCAKVIEITAEGLGQSKSMVEHHQAELIQSYALRTLLDLRRADTKRREEFFSQNITAMLHKLLTKPQALVGFHALQIIFNAACSGDDVILKHGDDLFEIKEENTALLHDHELIQVFLTDWKIWHKSVNFNNPKDPFSNFLVWSLLLDGLLNLVGVNHPHQYHNCKMLMQVGIVENILKGFQKLIYDDVKPFPTRIVTSKVIELLRVLVGSPPDVSILSKICDFLVAIHPPASTFVCHSPASFYFNLRSLKAPASRSLSLTSSHIQTQPEDISSDMATHSVENLAVQMTAGAQTVADNSVFLHQERFQANMGKEMTQAAAKDTFPSFGDSIGEDDNTNAGSTKLESRADSSWEDLPHTLSSTVAAPTVSEFSSNKKEDHSEFSTNIAQSSFLEGTTTMHSFHSDDDGQHVEFEDEMSHVIAELLSLLFVAVRIMPDMDAFELTNGPLCAKCLIVGIHHKSSDVRAGMIKLLAAYFSRCSKKTQDEFLQEKGFHLVANQIHQHMVSRPIVESCLYFLFGHSTISTEPLPFDGPGTESGMLAAPDTFSNHAVILLLATLSQTTHDAQLCQDVVARLQELFENVGPAADVMLDNGLTLALCNLLFDILSPSCTLLMDEKKALLKEIQHFMTCIAIKACVTAGSAHFQVSEDLFTLLHKVENEFKHDTNVHCQEASAQIQRISFDILLTVMEAMQKSSNGKSLSIQKNSPSFENGISQTDRTPHMSKEALSATTSTHVRRASGSVAVHSQKTAMTRRSISSASGLPGSSESFRSHRGNLRTRSYRGSQRRRINEAETARRLQRLIIIAVDKIVYCFERDSSIAREQMGGEISDSAHSSTNTENVETKLFSILVDWVESTLPVTNTCHGVRRGSRYGNLLNGNDFVKAWKRILNISRDSIIDQILRLIINFMSPKQGNRQIKYQPLFISQRSTAERMLSILFPRDSKFLKKIGICLDHVIITYKSEMNSAEKKALKDFCKIFQKCGGVVYRTSSSAQTFKHDVSITIDATNEIEKIQNQMDGESIREFRLWNEKNRDAFDQLRLRTDHLSSAVTQRAMDITQKVVLRQNIERKKMNAYEREVISNDLCVRNQWSCLLEQLAHERAVFYDEKRYPKSWQLDATEGPNRERRRMQRCHLNIADRFFLRKSKDHEDRENERKLQLDEKVRRMVSGEEDSPDHQHGNGEMMSMGSPLHDKRPLSFLFDDEYQSSDSNTIRVRLQTNEKICIVQNCTNVTASSETPGELMIGESSMYFVGDETISDLSLTQALFGECKVLLLSWRHEEVMEIHNRWWQLQDTAIEVFLTNGKTYLLAFLSRMDRDLMVKRLRELDLPYLVTSDNNLDAITQIWQSGRMTNFEYLTQLNKSAGRSFNDLMQYPVMPFILADYTSAILDLNSVETFRNLLRPISVPDDARMKHYQDRYRNLAEDYKNCPQDERELGSQPCHYGSHYSNSGTILHFLVRLPPYTQMFLDYQDLSFDIPDRTFHSMETTFRLSCYSSTTDVKELIPEFFFLPEFLCNSEGFDLGIRQCGLRVNHVSLPPWSKMDPRLFILIHRQVLESDYVSANLHGWIDLVFGYKQTGKAAIEAVNVFHPATYFGVDVNSVEDPVARKALKTMVKTYGQTPKQLFTHPHPPRSTKSSMKNQTPQQKVHDEPHRSSSISDLQSVQDTQPSSSSHDFLSHIEASLPQRPISSALGLKWGKYLGSPCAPDPVPFLIKKLSDQVGSLVPLQTNDVCVLSPHMSLLVKYNHDHRVRSSQNIDVKWSAVLTYGYPDNIIRLMTKKSVPEINLMCTPSYDKVTCSVIGSGCQVILLGHRSGAVVATKCNAVYDEPYDLEIRKQRTLYGHYAEVTCLVCCGEFRILASGSKDGTAILWDLDALTYIRSLTGHATAVSSMAISKTSGDICTVCNSGNNDGSHIRLWTINGSLVAAQDTKDRVNCVTFSSAPEGISVNVLAAGMSNGVIRLWSSWNLMWIRDIVIDGLQSPVMSLTYTQDSETLYAATSEGKVIGLCYRDKLEDKHPLLISFLKVEGARVS